MLSGILMVGLAVMGLGIMQSTWQFYTFYFLIALGYMCGGPLPNQVLISRWFSTARGKAMGIAYLGIGVGGMLVPHIARWLNQEAGWRTALTVLGGIIIVVAFPMAWFVKENPEEQLEAPKAPEPKVSLSNVLKSKSFYLLAIGSMCSIGAVAGVSQNLKLFLSLDMQYSQGQAAGIMSLVLGSSIIGRLLMGWLADRFAKKIRHVAHLRDRYFIHFVVVQQHYPYCHLCVCRHVWYRAWRGLHDHSLDGRRVVWGKSDGPGNGIGADR